jgi:hypothetical protein
MGMLDEDQDTAVAGRRTLSAMVFMETGPEGRC